jgi:hypothetical protein
MMTEKELEKAVMAMQSIILMARTPLVTRRGRVIIDEFIKENSPKPKAKKEEK